MGVIKHGMSNTRLYRVWAGMKQRCYNKHSRSYKYYGAKGVVICPEWHDFLIFAKWAYDHGYDERAPRGECMIDRIDGNGNYEPSNCRWTDIDIQIHNRHLRPKKTEKPAKSKKQESVKSWEDMTYLERLEWERNFNALFCKTQEELDELDSLFDFLKGSVESCS